MRGHTDTWKQTERRVAAALGGQRVGNTGRPTVDVRSRWLAVECKHRAQLPEWLKAALAEAQRHCGSGQLAVAVLHEAGQRHRNDVVCLTLHDFEQWFGTLELPEDADPADVQDALEHGLTIEQAAAALRA